MHDPYNLMEKLLKECEKWEKKINKKDCKHDWVYETPYHPKKRICHLCGREERREFVGFSVIDDFPVFSEWTLIIGDKEARKK